MVAGVRGDGEGLIVIEQHHDFRGRGDAPARAGRRSDIRGEGSSWICIPRVGPTTGAIIIEDRKRKSDPTRCKHSSTHCGCVAQEVCCGQSHTTRERSTADTGHAAPDGHAGQSPTIREGPTAKTGHAVGDDHAGQSATSLERTIANTGHAAADGNAGQSPTIRDRITANTGHAVGDDHAG